MQSSKKLLLILSSEPFSPEYMPLMSIFVTEQAKLFVDHPEYEVVFGSISILPTRFFTLDVSAYHFRNKFISGFPVYSEAIKKLIPLRLFPWFLLDQLMVLKLKKMLKSIEKDYGMPMLVHTHNVQYAGYIAAKLKKKYNYQLFHTEHSSAFFHDQLNTGLGRQLALVGHEAKRIIAVSNGLKNQLVKFSDPQLFEKFSVIANVPNNIFVADFEENRIIKKEPAAYNFLNVANLVDVKNHVLLINTFALYHKDNSASKLTIVGEGPLRKELESLIVSLKLKNAVELVGYCTKSQVKDHMIQADLFVLSSKFETYGVVVMEAMLCGLAVVTTPCSGPEELVNKLGMGEIALAHSPESLLEAIFDCLKRRQDVTTDAIRSAALIHFSPDAIRLTLEHTYSQLGV